MCVVCCCVIVMCYCNVLCKVEGVGNDGRIYILERPSPEAVQNKLWMLYLNAEEKKDELKNQLKYKVSVCSVLYVCDCCDVLC